MTDVQRLKDAFAAELRDARRMAGITQEELGFKADLHRTYISLLERSRKLPTLDTFFRLCAALEQEPAAFIARLQASFSMEEILDDDDH